MNSTEPNNDLSLIDSSQVGATALQQDDQIIQIERHLMGIVGQYIVVGSLTIIAIVIALAVVPRLTAYADQGVSAIVTILLGVFILGSVGFLCVANLLYWKNEWIIAEDGLIQILPVGFIRERVSQLSFDDLKDVTATQSGLFQKKFRYGTLRIITTKKHPKFVFAYCPEPEQYAKKILAAHEAFLISRQGKNMMTTQTEKRRRFRQHIGS